MRVREGHTFRYRSSGGGVFCAVCCFGRPPARPRNARKKPVTKNPCRRVGAAADGSLPPRLVSRGRTTVRASFHRVSAAASAPNSERTSATKRSWTGLLSPLLPCPLTGHWMRRRCGPRRRGASAKVDRRCGPSRADLAAPRRLCRSETSRSSRAWAAVRQSAA